VHAAPPPPRSRHRRRWAAVVTVLSLGAIGTSTALATAAAPDPQPRTVDAVAAGASTGVRTYAAVGDSITAGMVAGVDTLSSPGPTSWLNGETADRLVQVGGWAVPGTVTGDMRANVVPTPADVLVLLGGTNDLMRGIPWDETAANLQAIAATVGARSTLLVAIPPSDSLPAARSAFNARLLALASAAHWRYVDPWTAVSVNGAWAPGTTVEGIHPTAATAAAAGRLITDKAWQVAARRTG
jgi:acyl-CoA thioesterase I